MNFFNYIISPLDQFAIIKYIGIEAPIIFNSSITLTNIGFYIVIALLIIITFHILTSYTDILRDLWLSVQEAIYVTVYSIVISQMDNKDKRLLIFPFIYSLFIFILVSNLVSLIPYNFAPTSHFLLTFFLSFSVVIGATFYGFFKHGLEFFSLFVPAGCPIILLPLLVIIELISYISRNISLGLRLAANILSGHMLLSILSGFTYIIMCLGFVFFFFGLLPLSFITAFSGLEIGIAFVQAQVFIVLSCSYIKDCVRLH